MRIFLLALLLTPGVFATSQEVSCWQQSCLKQGWTEMDYSTGLKKDVACYREGCEVDGWIIASALGKSYTQCKAGGCFVEGWYLIDQNNQTLLEQSVCGQREDGVSDCWTAGWTIYGREGQRSHVSCFEQDCAQRGWLRQTADGKITHAYCKSGGCLVEGWREF